jgi:hypothetical protein
VNDRFASMASALEAAEQRLRAEISARTEVQRQLEAARVKEEHEESLIAAAGAADAAAAFAAAAESGAPDEVRVKIEPGQDSASTNPTSTSVEVRVGAARASLWGPRTSSTSTSSSTPTAPPPPEAAPRSADRDQTERLALGLGVEKGVDEVAIDPRVLNREDLRGGLGGAHDPLFDRPLFDRASKHLYRAPAASTSQARATESAMELLHQSAMRVRASQQVVDLDSLSSSSSLDRTAGRDAPDSVLVRASLRTEPVQFERAAHGIGASNVEPGDSNPHRRVDAASDVQPPQSKRARHN